MEPPVSWSVHTAPSRKDTGGARAGSWVLQTRTTYFSSSLSASAHFLLYSDCTHRHLEFQTVINRVIMTIEDPGAPAADNGEFWLFGYGYAPLL